MHAHLRSFTVERESEFLERESKMYVSYGWPKNKVRLGKYKRDSESVQREGELQAVWSPDAKLIAICQLLLCNLRLQIGGKQPSGLSLATIYLLLSEQVPFANKNLSIKTDGRHWVDLFPASGRSTVCLRNAFSEDGSVFAASYILVIAKLEGPAVSQYCALHLSQATLDESLYELAGELLQMDTLRSRLDADFLLAHMCYVKFKEWIVVLATLLGQSEVLFDLF